MKHGQPEFSEEEQALFQGCARFVLWGLGALVYLVILTFVSRRLGKYQEAAVALGMGFMFIVMAFGGAPFATWAQFSPWLSPLRDHPDKDDPTLGQAYFVVIGLGAIIVGAIMALSA